VAILDPRLTENLPAHLTASTGMDAMTHAVESFLSQQRNPISDAMALHAIRLTTKYLPVAVENPGDMLARGQMQIAALTAGWAFSNALLGLVHAMAHSLGAVCRVPHGLANGILLPHVMLFNLEEVPELMADIALAMGAAPANMPAADAGAEAVAAMHELTRKIGLPRSLKDVGVQDGQLLECAELALTDGSVVYNPRMVMEAQEVLEIFKKAF
jgi:alcohol dehydrogenase class IV